MFKFKMYLLFIEPISLQVLLSRFKGRVFCDRVCFPSIKGSKTIKYRLPVALNSREDESSFSVRIK